MNTQTCVFRCSHYSYSVVPKLNQLCCHLHKWIKAKEMWCRVLINQLHVNTPSRKGLGESLQWSLIVLQGWIGNQRDIVTHITIKTCLWCQLIIIMRVGAWESSLCRYGCELCMCAAECQCWQKSSDPTPATSTLNCRQRLLIHIQHFSFPSNLYLHVLVAVLQVHCVWVSMFGTELFNCMPAHQWDFSQGQG